MQSWLQVSFDMDRYYPLSSRFVLGNYIHAYYSSRNFSQTYTAPMMQAGEFAPTAHSKITYNEALRANQFIGAGVMPNFLVTPVFHVRAEVYGFAPIFPIVCNEESKASYGKLFSRIEYMGELSLVVKLPFGAISAYLNHYSSPSKNRNIGHTLGWQIFGSRFIE